MQPLEYIPIDKIEFDPENPRLPLDFQNAPADKVVEWMLIESNLVDLVASIAENGYFDGEPIIVVAQKDKPGYYTVVEGNRRLAASKLLHNPDWATIHLSTVRELASEAAKKGTVPDKLPAYIAASKQEIAKYLGFRHVTGVQPWPLVSKARFLYSLYTEYKNPTVHVYRELAKAIGSKAPYVRRLIIGYELYLEIKENHKAYGLQHQDVDESEFNLSVITDAVTKYTHIAAYLSFDMSADQPVRTIQKDKLKDLVGWLYVKRPGLGTVLGDSRNLRSLNLILKFPQAIAHLNRKGDIQAALKYTDEADTSIERTIQTLTRTVTELEKAVDKADTTTKAGYDELLDLSTRVDKLLRGFKAKIEE